MTPRSAGEGRPGVRAPPAGAGARRKITELEAALDGAELFTPAHAALLAAMLERIDRVNAEIARLTEVIDRLLAPYQEQLQQGQSMPCWGRRTDQDPIAAPSAQVRKL